ncbi:GNAT family N-acetyltransferase [Komagataeibacter intermedius]|uniref:Acetyltransferase n=1 Tax=Komagataeibacter intermedius AF2 TaxID=1458464 RepID=A0A0N1FNZ8_9PROT|nr:GNAT family N-acetyltransferase [Komagataeibacter intermedius]KPH89031.1 acetyltransferase [Komagataeibacter intermedius AF2]MCF3635098.1 GNAT family N-acetyltransferase [Komagataeibacter intermedius]
MITEVPCPAPQDGPGGDGTRVGVDVTFLCMDRPPPGIPPALPHGFSIRQTFRPGVMWYRGLYDAVGREYCWWLRRVMPDADLAALLSSPGIGVHVLYDGDAPAGFCELDSRYGPDINIAYFGLLPAWIGRGVGRIFLHQMVARAWAMNPAVLRVNTCSADHPRALPNYQRAGFRKVRTLHEIWTIPDALGLNVPDCLRLD